MPASSLFLFLLLLITGEYLAGASPQRTQRRSGRRSLPFSAKLSTSGVVSLPQADRARAASLLRLGKPYGSDLHSREAHIVDVTNAVVAYIASVGIGEPPEFYNLIVDTGSANTWIGAHKDYKPTSTSKPANANFSISYGSGNVDGDLYYDQLTLSDELVITDQMIGVANKHEGFANVDGILGLGPAELVVGPRALEGRAASLDQALQTQGKIGDTGLGVFYKPTVSEGGTGQLDFGGYDRSKFEGDIHWFQVTDKHPSSKFWGFDTTVTYGGEELLKSSGIADTGTSLLLLREDAFKKFISKTGAKYDEGLGLYKITQDQYKALKPLDFLMNGSTFSLVPNALIWPRSMNEKIGGRPEEIYLIVASLGPTDQAGLDLIIGFTFFQRFYTVYDNQSKKIGFAKTAFTNAQSN